MATTFTNLRVFINPFPISPWTFGSTDTTADAGAGVTITLDTNGTTSVTKEADDETLINTTTNWYTPTTTNIGTSYWVQATLVTGSAATSGTFGSRLQLNSARAWNWTTTAVAGVKSGQIKFDFYDASTGGNLVGSVNADFTVTPGAAFTPVTRTYTTGTAATETAPSGATNVIISAWGGGGGGSRGYEVMCFSEFGGGGGAGGYSQTSTTISGGQTLIYTVGAGGIGGTTANNQTSGSATSVSSGTKTITTMTGNGGIRGTAGVGGAGGTASGGTTQNTTGTAGSIPFGGAAVVGWNSNTGGLGGEGGEGLGSPGTAGGTGKVIFYYT